MRLAASALPGSCESSSGVGFSVGLPTNNGSMDLGMSTTNAAGGPFGHGDVQA